LFRHDLATIVEGLPYADGRYQHATLARFPSSNGSGYIASRPHPKTNGPAPVAFALVEGIASDRRTIEGFWVAQVVRGEGVGDALARVVISSHDGPWTIAFQHANVAATTFWRRVANESFGPGNWTETTRPVPGRPDASPDHFISFD
jgi:predicted acetyltransferase